MQYRVTLVTDPQTNKPTHKQTGPITIHCAAKFSAQCNERVPFYTPQDSGADSQADNQHTQR